MRPTLNNSEICLVENEQVSLIWLTISFVSGRNSYGYFFQKRFGSIQRIGSAFSSIVSWDPRWIILKFVWSRMNKMVDNFICIGYGCFFSRSKTFRKYPTHRFSFHETVWDPDPRSRRCKIIGENRPIIGPSGRVDRVTTYGLISQTRVVKNFTNIEHCIHYVITTNTILDQPDHN